MTPYGLHHRYYARQVGTYAGSAPSSQFPRGHGGMGQGEYCLGAAGNVIPCDSSGVMATLPTLPGGGWIPSGQNIQTAPPTATTPALPTFSAFPNATLMRLLPYLAGGTLFFLLGRSGKGSSSSRGESPAPKRRRRR